MRCSYCGRDVPDAKKTCPYCGSFMVGYTINNVTGEYGYRDENGMFHSCKSKSGNKGEMAQIDITRIKELLAGIVLDDGCITLPYNGERSGQ